MDQPFISFPSPRGHYAAHACIFWCFDARFSDLYDEFLKQKGFDKSKIDLVKIAGGAQALAMDSGIAAAGGIESDKAFAASQVAKSIKLHRTNRIVLMVHLDCGGYGGSKAFDDDREKEWSHHLEELKKAAAFIRQKFPEIGQIECYIADFDGVHEAAVRP